MSALDGVRSRLRGEFTVDRWGGDEALVGAVEPFAGALVRTAVQGGDGLPATGPALVVSNRRIGVGEVVALALAVRRATGRSLRFLGIPDVAPIGPVLRRFGGAVASRAEVSGLLRAGHIVGLSMGHTWRRPVRAGRLDPDALLAAVEVGAPIIPVAVVGGELGGRWRVLVGPAVVPPSTGRDPSPLAMAELGDDVRRVVQELLDEAFPPHWLFG